MADIHHFDDMLHKLAEVMYVPKERDDKFELSRSMQCIPEKGVRINVEKNESKKERNLNK
jgi:hypothetical protein